ncbi:MAG TPA: succinate dehydrogenase cytochrome b subunit [Chitinophagales bacterium]|nr:succinate dehydrogenase cytochrome b subunit [Chitinophagales bacterium]
MAKSNFLTSAIGKKFVMGATGLFLIVFLLVHCYANFQVFLPDGRERFGEIAHFLGTNLATRVLEIGLIAFFLLHIIQGIMLEIQNRAKRPVKFAVNPGNKTSRWYSRSMGLLGTLILLFLIIHMVHFWAPNRLSQLAGNGEIDLYARMELVFESGWVVLVYTLGCISLGWHLAHGFWSAFHTLGLSSFKYKKMIQTIGYVFAIVISLAFISMPLAFHFGWIECIQSFFQWLS